MQKFWFLFFSVLFMVEMAFSAQDLEFSKQRNYGFGSGEYGTIYLNLKNFETYDYQSEIKPPFVLKTSKNGNLEIIYDIRIVPDSELEVDKTYRESFIFTKKNIGKKEKLNLSATYKPEIRFVMNDSLFTDFVNIKLDPDKTSEILLLTSLKDFRSKFDYDIPGNIVSISSDNGLIFSEGNNSLEITLLKEENMQTEITLYRTVNNSKINQLYIYLTVEGFSSQTVIPEENISEQDSAFNQEQSSDQAALEDYSNINNEENRVSSSGDEPSGSGFGFMSIVIIIIMGIVIIVLAFLLISNSKGALYEKYETFFADVATLVKVNIKGNNLDRSIEEIMMILLEKFEFSNTDEEKKSESKKVLKKPANLKSPVINRPAEKQNAADDKIDIDLNFGEKSAPEGQKPVSAPKSDKKVTRGFDFLDEDN